MKSLDKSIITDSYKHRQEHRSELDDAYRQKIKTHLQEARNQRKQRLNPDTFFAGLHTSAP